MTLYQGWVPGRPVPWQRTAGAGSRRFTNKRYRAWSQGAELFMRRAGGGEAITGCVGLKLVVHLQRPKRRPSWLDEGVWATGAAYMTVGRGDLDNYWKATADCLERAGVIANDVQIVQTAALKQHAAHGQDPGVEVILHTPHGIARAG